MALRIHLTRIGKKKFPFYRVVVADSRKPRDGAFIESVGHYSPGKSGTVKLDLEKIENWLRKGAKPTNTVARLVARARKETEAGKETAETTEEVEVEPQKEEKDEGVD